MRSLTPAAALPASAVEAAATAASGSGCRCRCRRPPHRLPPHLRHHPTRKLLSLALIPRTRFAVSSSSSSASSSSSSSASSSPASDADRLLRAASLSLSSAGEVAPHPNAACILVSPGGDIVSEAYLYGQGGECPEAQVARASAGRASGGTAYLNLEPLHGDLAGDDAAVASLLASGVSRVVIGLRHPLAHLRGRAVGALRGAGLVVDVLGDEAAAEEAVEGCKPSSSSASSPSEASEAEAVAACQQANEALIHLAATGRPFSVLKYAMTLDGKASRD